VLSMAFKQGGHSASGNQGWVSSSVESRRPRFLGSLPRQAISGWSYLLKKSVSNVETLERAVEGAASGTVTLDPAIVAAMQPKAGAALHRSAHSHARQCGSARRG
jgi:hypothetical protein